MIETAGNFKRRKTKETQYKKWEYHYIDRWLTHEELMQLNETVIHRKILSSRLNDIFAGRHSKYKTLEELITTPYQPRRRNKSAYGETTSTREEFLSVLRLFRPII